MCRAACSRWCRRWCCLASHGGWLTKASVRLDLGGAFQGVRHQARLAIGRSHSVGNDGHFAKPGLGVAANAEEPCWPRALTCVSIGLVHIGQHSSPLVFASLAFSQELFAAGLDCIPHGKYPSAYKTLLSGGRLQQRRRAVVLADIEDDVASAFGAVDAANAALEVSVADGPMPPESHHGGGAPYR